MKARVAKINDTGPTLSDRLTTARSHTQKVGVVLPLYSAAIRAVGAAPTILKTQDPTSINSFAVSSTLVPIRISPILTDAFQFAAAEFYPAQYKKLAVTGTPELKSVLKLFSASEIAAVLGITYYFRLLKKACDIEEFGRLSSFLSLQLSLGAVVGAQTGSNFGRGGGLVACGLRALGLGVLLRADVKAFKKLRRLIDDSWSLDHFDFQLQHFGCTHCDVASVLAGDLGYGPVAREALLNAQSNSPRVTTTQGIWWQHTLAETIKLWTARQPDKGASRSKSDSAAMPKNQLDGVQWLWGQSVEPEVLPGMDEEQLMELAQTSSGAIAMSTQAKENSGPIPILIVEDDHATAAMMQKQLQSLGPITTCHDAESALALLNVPQQSLPFNLVLLDVSLPGMSGLDLLNELRQTEKSMGTPNEARCKVLMVTGHEDPQTVMKAFSHGADGYLTKPLNKSEVREELAKHEIHLGEK